MNAVLADQVVIVTGGAGLLGRSLCEAIARNGGRAVIADRNGNAAKAVAQQMAVRFPGQALGMEVDITSEASISAAIAAIRSEWGRLDAVVNSAYPRNTNYGRRMEDVTYDDFCDNVGMHLGGYFLVSQQFAAQFSAQGHGSIVNIASVYGVMAPRFELYESTSMTMPVEYAAIKSAIIHLTKYFAKYLQGSGVRVNSISPGGIWDDQPAQFVERYNAHCSGTGLLRPEDIGGALVFLLSELSSHMNGQNLIVDDGFSL